MPYELIDHQADVGLQATGATLDEALTDGVRGLLSLMVERESVKPITGIAVEASGNDPGALFVDLLNAVLAAKDIHATFFHDIKLDELDKREDGSLHVAATIYGEPIDLSRHEVDSDVKAATYGGLLVRHDEDGWLLRCVLDL